MVTPAPSLDEQVQIAVTRGDLPGAAALYRTRLAEHRDPEARMKLARILHFIELPASRDELERALDEFSHDHLPRRAAVAASRLAVYYRSGIGNRIAAKPWFAQAWRLLENEGDCVERGYVAVADIGCTAENPTVLRERGEIALAMARKFHDVDLEAKALVDSGLALVELGELEDGLKRVDEAIAIVASGRVRDKLTATQALCAFFSACFHAGDLARVESWARVLRERRLLGEHGAPAVNARCESVFGSLLCSLGQWGEAEDVLERAVDLTRLTSFTGRLQATSALAELRIRQGRLDEAEQLLVGHDDFVDALIPMAHLHIARGEYDLAAATARRGLRLLQADRLRAVSLLVVVFEASLARADLVAAAEASRELDARASVAKLPSLDAEAGIARARLAAIKGDEVAAVHELETALASLVAIDLPLHKARLHTLLAKLHAERDPAAARVDARAALAIHARIDAALVPDDARELQALAGGAGGTSTPSTRAEVATLVASPSGWVVTHERASFMLRDTKGLHYLAQLLTQPTIDHHVFDLVALTDPPDDGSDASPNRRSLGDAGPTLDASAKTSYRRRIELLRDEVAEAEARHDQDAARTLQDELDALVHELARAVGLGGRDRRVASGAEKARLNVTRALRAAIERIVELDPAGGQALAAAVRTGTYCCYRPDPDQTIVWKTQSSQPTTEVFRRF